MSTALDAAFGPGPYTVDDLHNSPDDGTGFELWNGWLIEKMSPSLRHNRISRGLRTLLIESARRAGANVVVDGGEYELALPSGVRKPDVFVLDASAEVTGVAEDATYLDPADILLVAEVVSRRSGSEIHDRTVKRIEYAMAGIPAYWIVDFRPEPRIEVLELDHGRYERKAPANGDELLVVDHPFEISAIPGTLYELGRRDSY